MEPPDESTCGSVSPTPRAHSTDCTPGMSQRLPEEQYIKTMMILVLQYHSELASIMDQAPLPELGGPLMMAHAEFQKILVRLEPGTPHSPDWVRFL